MGVESAPLVIRYTQNNSASTATTTGDILVTSLNLNPSYLSAKIRIFLEISK